MRNLTLLTQEIVSGGKASVKEKNDLEALLLSLAMGFCVDMVLKVQGGSRSVHAHGYMLAQAAPRLHTQLLQGTSTVDIPGMTIEALELFLVLLYISGRVITAPIPELDNVVDKHFLAIHHAYHKYEVWDKLKPVMDAAWQRNLAPAAHQIVKYGYLVKSVPMPKREYKCADIDCHSCSFCLRTTARDRELVRWCIAARR